MTPSSVRLPSSVLNRKTALVTVPLFSSVVLGILVVLAPPVAAALCAALFSVLLAGSPRLALSFWWGVMIAVPYWIQVTLGPVQLPPQVLATLIVLPAVLLSQRGGDGWRLRAIDIGFVLFLLVILVAYKFAGSTIGVTSQMVVQGTLAYVVGRLLIPAAGRDFTVSLLAITLAFVGAWAILEYLSGTHVFAELAPVGGRDWASLSDRGDSVRSEAAFGHPIALGGALAMAIPFIFASPYSVRTRLVMLAVVGGGLLTTVSRGPFLAAILGLLLITLFGGTAIGRRGRVLLGVLSSAIVFVPVLIELSAALESAGRQVSNSAENRYLLYKYFPEDVQALGIANNVSIGDGGRQTWRSFGSVDSTVITIGIDFGWIALLLVGACFLVVGLRMLRREASVFQVALFAQLPLIVTVALITQYRSLLFFLVGAAAATWQPLSVQVSSRALQRAEPRSLGAPYY